jgi:hypothetical protein
VQNSYYDTNGIELVDIRSESTSDDWRLKAVRSSLVRVLPLHCKPELETILKRLNLEVENASDLESMFRKEAQLDPNVSSMEASASLRTYRSPPGHYTLRWLADSKETALVEHFLEKSMFPIYCYCVQDENNEWNEDVGKFTGHSIAIK